MERGIFFCDERCFKMLASNRIFSEALCKVLLSTAIEFWWRYLLVILNTVPCFVTDSDPLQMEPTKETQGDMMWSERESAAEYK